MTQQELSPEAVKDALKDIIAEDKLDNLAACGKDVKVDVILSSTADPKRDEILAAVKNKLNETFEGLETVTVGISLKTPPAKPGFGNAPAQPQQASGGGPSRMPSPKGAHSAVKNIIAISSGKGGVGKTSVTVNLACALKAAGHSVGILDADIYGPNVPIMMGLRGSKLGQNEEKNQLALPENHGVKVVSMAFLIKEEQPVVWRGPMLDKVIRQFYTDSDWGDSLDYLLIDLPPGTGDAQLTVMQGLPVTAAIIVTTPQEVAIHDSRKGLAMFRDANVPLLGIIENMSYFKGDDGKEYEIFGRGGGQKAAESLDVPFLGEIPIVAVQREQADAGIPIVVHQPESDQAERFTTVAKNIVSAVEKLTLQPA